MVDLNELETRFGFHAGTAETIPKHEAVRATCLSVATQLVELTPASREQSLAITALEDAMMWANAAIARRS